MTTTAKPKGFGVSSQTPRQIIKDMCQADYLRPDEIDEFVQETRDYYARSYYDALDLTEYPLECRRTELTKPTLNKKGVHNISYEPFIMKYENFHGYWGLNVVQFSDNTDFSVLVNIGGHNIFDKTQARVSIEDEYGDEVYQEWRKLVLSEYDESIAWLMQDIATYCPGIKAHSCTNCESAERLMARTPNVYLHRKVAFLIVPN